MFTLLRVLLIKVRYLPCAGIFFSASVVTGAPPTPHSLDRTSSIMTQVTGRSPSPSTDTMASFTFQISSHSAPHSETH